MHLPVYLSLVRFTRRAIVCSHRQKEEGEEEEGEKEEKDVTPASVQPDATVVPLLLLFHPSSVSYLVTASSEGTRRSRSRSPSSQQRDRSGGRLRRCHRTHRSTQTHTVVIQSVLTESLSSDRQQQHHLRRPCPCSCPDHHHSDCAP
jgi:hypothetical protein